MCLPVVEQVAHIDFLTFSFEARLLAYAETTNALQEQITNELIREGERDEAVRARLAQWAFDQFVHFNAPGLVLESKLCGMRHFFENHCVIRTPQGAVCGYVMLGGKQQRGKICIELTGAACAHITVWDRLQWDMEEVAATITRIDIAHDEYEGLYNLSDVERWYNEGLFTTRGRPPAMEKRGWNDSSGRTIYIGKNANNQQLCVYEKGKEQGNPESPWIRFEGRFGCKYRTIPLEVMRNPTAYLVGHFPALFWINATSCRMRTSKERAKANLVSALKHFKRQNGALLNLLSSVAPDRDTFWRLIDAQVRDTLPTWALQVPAAQLAFEEAITAVYYQHTIN